MSATQLDQGAALAPCELRQGRYGLFTVRLFQLDLNRIQAHLADQVGNAPGLLQNAPVVIDPGLLGVLPNGDQSSDLLARLRAAGLQPLAVAQGPGADADTLGELFKLPVIAASPMRRGPGAEEPNVPDEPTVQVAAAEHSEADRESDEAGPDLAQNETPATSTNSPDVVPSSTTTLSPVPGSLYINAPVRSGQQIYAKGRDLVITAAVSAGAEVIADGCIHVYGRLAGKALAGAQGNEQARIYALNFQPELVSIAGQYRLMESIPESLRGLAVEVVLDNERLELKSIGAR